MKTRLYQLLPLIVLSFGLLSCETGENEGTVENYWSANALVHMKLRGSVKTLTIVDYQTTIYRFNTDGNITSKEINGDGYSNTISYVYANGKLMSETNTFTNMQNIQARSSSSLTTQYEYANTGKYIPRGPMHLYEIGLVPALSAVISETNRQDYTFHGSDLWIVSSANGIPNDTIVFKYKDKYPVSCSNSWSYMNDITYASNGMFLTYTEGFIGLNYNDARVYTFLADDEFQLIDKMVNSNFNGTATTKITTLYTYNNHKDITSESSDLWTTQWTDYVYDSADNWTSRKMRYSTGENTWSEYTTETRNIEYY